MTFDLQSIWDRRESLRAVNKQKMNATEPMPIHVQVWFNVMLAEIIAHWNEGGESSVVISGKELLGRLIKAFKTQVNADYWQRALNTLCLPDIQGAMNFLLFTEDDEHYLVNHPWIGNYMDSELGKQWAPALQMMYGLNVGALREPKKGLESQWVLWLKENMNRGQNANRRGA